MKFLGASMVIINWPAIVLLVLAFALLVVNFIFFGKKIKQNKIENNNKNILILIFNLVTIAIGLILCAILSLVITNKQISNIVIPVILFTFIGVALLLLFIKPKNNGVQQAVTVNKPKKKSVRK